MVLTFQIVKSLHIIAIIAWMAGLLYLYRLFVYHAEETEAVVKTRFTTMERRLFGIITVPAMIAALSFGIWLIILMPAYLQMGWLHLKLACVFGMLCMTLFASGQIDDLEAGKPRFRPRTYRILNEVPTLLLAIIVFLVILKPF